MQEWRGALGVAAALAGQAAEGLQEAQKVWKKLSACPGGSNPASGTASSAPEFHQVRAVAGGARKPIAGAEVVLLAPGTRQSLGHGPNCDDLSSSRPCPARHR